MADVAAAAARGAALAPSLVIDDEVEADPSPLPAEVADALPALMREVVTDGSGGAVADVPGGPVHGKTGTAEYQADEGLGTHAWFIGWQDDLAVALEGSVRPVVLVALSNKDFVGETLDRPVKERLTGTLATTALAIAQGVELIRVHDVLAARGAAELERTLAAR